MHTAADVKEAFEAVTGEKLREGRVLDLTRYGGGTSVPLLPDSRATRKYGEFRFIVQTHAATNPQLSASEPPNMTPDKMGIFWQYQPRDEFGGDHWSATKFADNVKLVWFTETREVNEQWTTLDAVLERLRQ